MTSFTRRALVRDGLLSIGSSLAGATIFGQLAALPRLQAAFSPNAAASNGHTLVVVQLAGGNDGLNTIIPYTDPLYAQSRPTIGVPASKVLPLVDNLGLNPDLSALMPLWNAGQMAVVENIGYPNPILSHFQSMYIWQTLDLTGAQGTSQTGWLGKYLSVAGDSASHPFTGLDNGVILPTAFMSPGISVPTISSAASFTIAPDRAAPAGNAQRTSALLGFYSSFAQEQSASAFASLLNTTAVTADSATKQFTAANTAYKPAATYPKTPLGAGLQLIAAAITQNLGLRVGYVTLGGFDTHANEVRTHAVIYPELAEAVAAFWQDMQAQGAAGSVLMMTWSEFGRRVKENGSQGTDHGTASPQLVFGPGVKGGIHGGAPNLANLDQFGNLIFSADFRSYYATILDKWMGVDAASVLGGSFPDLDFLG